MQAAVRTWTWIHVLGLAHFCVFFLYTWLYPPGRGYTRLCPPSSVCSPAACGRTPRDEYPRAWDGIVQCIRPVHVPVRPWTWIHVSEPSLFGVFAQCTWLYATGRGSTCLSPHFSVCSPSARGCTPLDVDSPACACHFPVNSPCARGCTPLDVDPRGWVGPFRCVRPAYVAVPPST